MISKFEKFWSVTRSIAISVFIIASFISVIKANCHLLEMDYTGPGSEADRLNESTKDRENKEAFDRVREGSDSQRDIDKAREFERDHSA